MVRREQVQLLSQHVVKLQFLLVFIHVAFRRFLCVIFLSVSLTSLAVKCEELGSIIYVLGLLLCEGFSRPRDELYGFRLGLPIILLLFLRESIACAQVTLFSLHEEQLVLFLSIILA
jgi:hypothetical protein